jgi:hypothetical protein
MTAMIGNFVPADLQLFRLGIGDAMSELVRQRYPRDTAKHIAKAWKIDPSTAANVVRGHCSERTLTKAFLAEGWALIDALGSTITGETYHEYEERKLLTVIEEGVRAQTNLHSLRARREAMEARARELDALDSGPVDDAGRRGGLRNRPSPDEPGRSATPRKTASRKA